MVDDWKKWAIVAGGVAAVASNWYAGIPYLAVIGGAVAVVVALLPE